jgi:hypothetical protein
MQVILSVARDHVPSRGPLAGGVASDGQRLRSVTLRSAAAREVERILEPLRRFCE